MPFERAFDGQNALIIMDTFLCIGQDASALVFFNGAVKNAVCSSALFRERGTNFTQFRRCRSLNNTSTVEHAIDLVGHLFVWSQVSELILNGRRTHGVLFEEVMHSVKALNHAFDHEKVFTFERSALDFQAQ